MFNQQEVNEISLYAGVGAFTLKSLGLNTNELINAGYSEKFAEYFSSGPVTIRQGEDEVDGYRLVAIMENEMCGEMPLVFNIADKELPVSSNGKLKFIGDTLETAWATDSSSLKEIAETHRSEYYRGVCSRVLENNGHIARIGEEKYAAFLMAIVHPRIYDENRNNLIPDFVKALREKGFDFDTVVKGDFSKLQDLVAFLNGRLLTFLNGKTEGKTTVDHIAIPVVISTSNSGKQNMRFEEGYNGENFFRSNGQVGIKPLSSFKEYITERQNRSGYSNFFLAEPLRKVEIGELTANVSLDESQEVENEIDGLDLSEMY